MNSTSPDALSELVGLVVHDLRNPSATVGANVAFVRDVLPDGGNQDVAEALEDVEAALGQLMLGLEQLSWVGRWLGGQPPLQPVDGDAAEFVRGFGGRRGEIEVRAMPADGPLPARGAASLQKVLEVLLANAQQHARRGQVTLACRREGGEVVVEWTDTGPALAPEDRARAFTLEGQHELKTKANGRYGRVVGLFAAAIAVAGLGGRLETDGVDGAAVFRVRLPAL